LAALTTRRDRRSAGSPRLGALAVPEIALALLVSIVPIGALIVISFGSVDPVTLDVDLTGSLASYRTLLSAQYRPVIARSYGLAALAVLLAAAVGTPAALALSRLPASWQRRALAAVVAPSFVNFAVRLFAWQGLLGASGPVAAATGSTLLFRPPAVVIGMVGAYVPIYVLAAHAALSRVDTALIEAAADLGADPATRTRRVVLPLAAPGLVTGAVLVGVLAVGEFIVPAVLGGGKVLLLGSILADRGAGRGQPLAGAIVALMLATLTVGGAVVWWARRRWKPAA
jgi:spermidine/putrescine transport system permease protein